MNFAVVINGNAPIAALFGSMQWKSLQVVAPHPVLYCTEIGWKDQQFLRLTILVHGPGKPPAQAITRVVGVPQQDVLCLYELDPDQTIPPGFV